MDINYQYFMAKKGTIKSCKRSTDRSIDRSFNQKKVVKTGTDSRTL